MFAAAYRNTEAGIYQRNASQIAADRQAARDARIRAEARAEAIAEIEEKARLARMERIAKWEAHKREAIIAARRVQDTRVREAEAIPLPVFHRTYQDIEATACRVFGVTRNDIRSNRRQRQLVFARQFVMYWAARLTRLSFPQIGKIMGGRDHTTALHGRHSYLEKRAKMGRTLPGARISIQRSENK